VEAHQRFAHGLGDALADGALVVKLHLAFGRVDVHVDERGIDFEAQAADRVTALHQRRVVAFDEGKVDAAVLDGPPVDEDVLVLARGTGDAGSADEAPEAEGTWCVVRGA